MLVLCYIFERRNSEAFNSYKDVILLLKGARHLVWPSYDPHLTLKEITVMYLKCGCSKRVLSAVWSSASCLSRGDKSSIATLLKDTGSKKLVVHYHIPFFSEICFEIRNEQNCLSSADGK